MLDKSWIPPSNPAVEAAMAWAGLLHDDRFEKAWAAMDADWRERLCHELLELETHRDFIESLGVTIDAVDMAIAHSRPGDDLWVLAEEVLTEMRGIMRVDWGWAANRRPVSPGYELALMVDGSRRRDDADAVVPAVKFLMRNADDAWKVAGIASGDQPLPGWPPEVDL